MKAKLTALALLTSLMLVLVPLSVWASCWEQAESGCCCASGDGSSPCPMRGSQRVETTTCCGIDDSSPAVPTLLDSKSLTGLVRTAKLTDGLAVPARNTSAPAQLSPQRCFGTALYTLHDTLLI